MYHQISRNKRNSIIVITGFLLVWLLAGFVIGEFAGGLSYAITGAIILGVLGVIAALYSYYLGSATVLSAVGAHEADPQQSSSSKTPITDRLADCRPGKDRERPANLAGRSRVPELPPRAPADFECILHREDDDFISPLGPVLGRLSAGKEVGEVAEALDDLLIERFVGNQERHDNGRG